MSEALITPQDIKTLLRRMCRNTWLVIAGILAGSASAYWTIYVSPKLYEAKATILIESPRYDYDIATLRALGIYQPFVILENEMRLLQSDELIKEALRKNNMQVTYIIEGTARESEIFKGSPIEAIALTALCKGSELRFSIPSRDSFILRGEGNKITGKFAFNDTLSQGSCTFVFVPNPRVIEMLLSIVPNPEKITYRVRFNSLDHLSKQYATRLKVQKYEWPATYLDISITDAIPERAITLLDTIVTTFIEWSHQQESEGYIQALKIIDQRINEITNLINQLQTYLIASNAPRTAHPLPPLLSSTDNPQQQLKELRQKEEELQSKLELLYTLQNVLSSTDTPRIVPAVVELLGSEILTSMFQELLNLQDALEQALQTRQPTSPTIVRLQEDIKKQKQLITLKLHDYISILEKNLQNTRKDIATLTENLQKSYIHIPTHLTTEIQLEMAKRLYSSLAEKKITMELTQKQAFYKRKLIQSAFITGRIYPQTEKTFLTHIGVALALAFVLIGIRELFFDTIDTPEDLQKAARVPFLCPMPTTSTLKEPFSELFIAKINKLIGEHPSLEVICLLCEGHHRAAREIARLIEERTPLPPGTRVQLYTHAQLIQATLKEEVSPKKALVLMVFRACRLYRDHLEKSHTLLSSLGFEKFFTVLADYSPLASWLGFRSWMFIFSHFFKPVRIPCA